MLIPFQALYVLGSVLMSEQLYQEAIEVYRRIVFASPLVRYEIALALHHLGREREAHEECAIALAEMPNDPGVKALMAAIEQSGGTR